MTNGERLLLALNDGKWHSNFDLYRILYGESPCGRLGAVVFRLKHDITLVSSRRTIEAMHDGDWQKRYGTQQTALASPNPAQYWYRLVALADLPAAPEVPAPQENARTLAERCGAQGATSRCTLKIGHDGAHLGTDSKPFIKTGGLFT